MELHCRTCSVVPRWEPLQVLLEHGESSGSSGQGHPAPNYQVKSLDGLLLGTIKGRLVQPPAMSRDVFNQIRLLRALSNLTFIESQILHPEHFQNSAIPLSCLSPWPLLTCILIPDQTHPPASALSCGQRDPLSPGQEIEEDIPDVHHQCPHSLQTRADKEMLPKSRATRHRNLPSCLLHSKPLSSQSTGKEMQ